MAYGQGCCPSLGGVLFQDNYSSNASLSNYNFYYGDPGTPDPNYTNYFSASGGILLNTANPTYCAEQFLVTPANFNPALTDYTIQCDVMSAQVGGIFGIIFKGQTGADFYSFQINYGQWQFEKHSSSGWSYISTASTPTYTVGTWVHMTVVCCGTNFMCYLNFNNGNGNQLIFNVTDSTFTTGAVGIRSGYLNSPNQNEYKNYTVNSCSALGTPTNTPTVTPTFPPTDTPTVTPTPTNTLTFTLTPTMTPTVSPTPTPTPTPTLTNTPTITNTFTITNTPTITPTPTATPTITLTPVVADVFYVSKNTFNPSDPVSIFVEYTQYPGSYDLRIYNSAGEHIKTLASEELEAPISQSYQWDGTNKYGDPCASGVYLIDLVEPFGTKIKRVLLVR